MRKLLTADTLALRVALWIDACLISYGLWRDMLVTDPINFLLFVPGRGWAEVWTLYAIAALCRIADRVPHPKWSLAVNILGAFNYGMTAMALIIARWPHIELAASTTTLAVAAWWVLARTAIGSNGAVE